MNIVTKTRKKYKSEGNFFVSDENGTLAGLQIALNTGSVVDVVVKRITHEEFSVICECVEVLNSGNFAQKQIVVSGKLTNQRMIADNTSYLNAQGVLVPDTEALTAYELDLEGFIVGGGELKEGYFRQFTVIFDNMHAPIFEMIYESLEGKY
jgi:hypothetical protein